MVALVTDTDLVEVLVRLCAVLEKQPGSVSPADASAHLCALHTVAAELTDDSDRLSTIQVALSTHLAPTEPATWAAVVRTPALWEQFSGPVVHWNVDFSRIRRTRGQLSTSASVTATAVDVAFDEGCEVCTVTRSALMAHFEAWQTGHAAFCNRKDIGPPSALCVKRPLNLHAFHGTFVEHSFMVLIQSKLGHAVYPVRCVLVDHAPGDVVLGLPFRRRYDTALPVLDGTG
jgi:hypothetical protein